MKKKIVWMVVSGWMVAALLLTSCAPAVVEEEPAKVAPKEKVVVVPKEEVVPKEVVTPKKEANMVKWTGTKLDGTVVEKMIEKPRYGGVLVTAGPVQPTTWDDVTIHGGIFWQGMAVHEPLFLNDWARGPFGTEEWVAFYNMIRSPGTVETGQLAESWERPEPDTIIFHIRKGVRWALDTTSEASRLVGGREFTAADVAHSSVRNWTIGYPARSYKYLSDMENPENSIYVSPDDAWAVVFKAKPGGAGILMRHGTGARNKIFAPEVTEKYGEIISWKNVVGTGPFILKEYVTASSLTYERNPDYWGHDPFFPENQLPYLDGINFLIIPDFSTQLAALRTGRIDNLPNSGQGDFHISQEDARVLRKLNPDLEWARVLGYLGRIFMRNDTLPFDDVRVRQALHMAINSPELVDAYYGGEAELFASPVYPIPEFIDSGMYTPLEEMPQSVRELYEYHPDKARQLLAEAGYPDGFETNIIAVSKDVDLLSIIKDYWAKIGVDLKIEVKPFGTWQSLGRKKTYPQMYYQSSTVNNMIWSSISRKKGSQNYSVFDEPWHQVQYDKLIENFFDASQTVPVYTEPMAEGMPSWVVYTNEQQWFITLPMEYNYIFWQPWLKGFRGTRTGTHYTFGWPKNVWIDQELKKAMGY